MSRNWHPKETECISHCLAGNTLYCSKTVVWIEKFVKRSHDLTFLSEITFECHFEGHFFKQTEGERGGGRCHCTA